MDASGEGSERRAEQAPVGRGDGSGDGFVTAADGKPRWGLFGAAGVLLRHRDEAGEEWYFVAHRSPHVHRGGTWAIPGGAIDRGEPPLQAALRELEEETGLRVDTYTLSVEHEDDHGGWSYWTFVLDVPERFAAPAILTWETTEVRWVRRDELAGMPLFDAFRRTLVRLGVLAA